MSDTTAKLEVVEPPEFDRCASIGCSQPAMRGDTLCWRCREEVDVLSSGKQPADLAGAICLLLGLVAFGSIVIVFFFMRGMP